jgi:hypothetical protein
VVVVAMLLLSPHFLLLYRVTEKFIRYDEKADSVDDKSNFCARCYFGAFGNSCA